MPIDADLIAMLAVSQAALDRLGRPMTLDESRAGFRERSIVRGIQHPAREVEVIRAGDADLHLYRPEATTAAAPAILYLHGGGFVLGDVAAFAAQSQHLADRLGAVVAFLDYRLAPEHRFPAAHEDAVAGARALVEAAPRLGIDPRRITLLGDSAGGNLAIATAIATAPAIRWRALCLLCPWVDPRPYLGLTELSASDSQFAERAGLDVALMRWFAESATASPADAADPRLTSLLADLESLPPTLLFAAENDVLRDQGARFAAAASAAGVLREYRVFDGVLHNFFGHVEVSAGSRAAMDAVLRSLRAAL